MRSATEDHDHPGMDRIRGRESLLIARHRNHTGHDDRALRRGVANGRLTKLRNGAFVETAIWSTLRRDDRRRLEAAATAEMQADYIASHRSAAALWGVPTIRSHDGLVHGRVGLTSGTRTEHGMRKHAVADLDLHLTSVCGIACTDLERTILDLAATEPFPEAVVAVDWALREHTTHERLRSALEEWSPLRGRRRVEAVLDFGDGRSGSPGESWSRSQIHESGLPAPVLQARFDDHHGLIGYVDFYWPEENLIGEFDGFEKYKKPEMLRGRSPSEALETEKVREDRLRATPSSPKVSRWVWSTLTDAGALPEQLRLAGLRPHRRRT